MDSSSHKIYPVHGYNSRQFLEHYFADSPEMVFEEDSFIFPMKNLAKTFTEGHIKGDVLIDLSAGPVVHHLFSACEFFKQIIVLKVSDRCIMELKRWLDTRTGAFNWGHAAKHHGNLTGNSDQLQDKEGNVRSAVHHVLKIDLDKKSMADPIDLPPADCIISGLLLDEVCKDQEDYRRYLKNFSMMLKPGGHIMLLGALDMTYFKVGKDKIHGFKYNEEFARKALVEAGFVIDKSVVKPRTAESDLTDYRAVMFIAAHKK